MRSVNFVIVELDKAYNNEVEVSTGQDIIINTTIENVEFVNRVATVVHAPKFTILSTGDKVVVHHNIFRLRNDTKGNTIPSNFHIEGNKYFVPLTEIFMYKSDQDWKAISPYCFVSPIQKQVQDGFDLSATESTYKGRLQQKGVMVYPNEDLLIQGVQSGDTVMFSKNSEYEFNIDGRLLYKMSTKDILGVV